MAQSRIPISNDDNQRLDIFPGNNSFVEDGGIALNCFMSYVKLAVSCWIID